MKYRELAIGTAALATIGFLGAGLPANAKSTAAPQAQVSGADSSHSAAATDHRDGSIDTADMGVDSPEGPNDGPDVGVDGAGGPNAGPGATDGPDNDSAGEAADADGGHDGDNDGGHDGDNDGGHDGDNDGGSDNRD